MGDILEILPFEDPVIVLELDGATLWETLESALAKYPALEGWASYFSILPIA
jgi:2',3'-cyclic-nucleotide 2'-phosphodiesterase (5'-nucleotidase family)